MSTKEGKVLKPDEVDGLGLDLEDCCTANGEPGPTPKNEDVIDLDLENLD